MFIFNLFCVTMARSRKRIIYRKRRKYNIENRPIEIQFASQSQENGFYQNQTVIVPPSTVEGVRQVARITISLQGPQPLYWAIVYIPEGVTTTALFPNSDTLFEPSNYVLNAGVVDPDAGPIRISSKLRKNLNAGDRIYLLTATATNQTVYRGLVRYAVCYN